LLLSDFDRSTPPSGIESYKQETFDDEAFTATVDTPNMASTCSLGIVRWYSIVNLSIVSLMTLGEP
jgi:hypothetical protein